MCPLTAVHLFLVEDTEIQQQSNMQFEKYSVGAYKRVSAPKAKEPLWEDHILPHTHELFSVTSVKNIRVSTVQLESASTGCVSVFCTSEVTHTFLPSKSSSRSARVCWSCAAMNVSSFSCLAKAVVSSCLLKEREENH